MQTIPPGSSSALTIPTVPRHHRVLSVGSAHVTLPSAATWDWLCIGIALAVCLPFWLLPLWHFSLPIGFAGLYAQMAQEIAANGYALPETVPFYGPGGIPFAYPPLALYVMAVAVHTLHVPVFTYMRVVPVIFLALATAPTYLLAKELTGSSLKATIATVLIGACPELLYFHLGAGGVVRALGSLWTIAGLLATWKAMRGGGLGWLGAAGGLFGLTALTHPGNASFFALSMLVFVVAAPGRLASARTAVLISMAGLAVSAPWWLTVLQREGLDIFRLAAASHGRLSAPSSADLVSTMAAHLLLIDVPALWQSTLLHVCAVLGAIYAVSKKQWLWPLWLASTVALMPDPWRFVMLVGSMAVAILAVDVGAALRTLDLPRSSDRSLAARWPVLLAAFLLTVNVVAEFLWWPRHVTPMVNRAEVAMGAWMRENTPTSSRVLVVPRVQSVETDRFADSFEWFAYLTQRTSTVGYWGSEWLADKGDQGTLMLGLLRCSRAPTLACVEEVDQQAGPADYLVVLDPRAGPELPGVLSESGRWMPVFENTSVTVWQRVGPA
jgi:hypothetical protein